MIKNKIHIRPIRKEELLETTNIFVNTFNSVYGNDYHWNKRNALVYLKFFYKEQKDLFLVALLNDKIVGGILGLIPDWHNDSLTRIEIFIKESYRGSGIGKKLLKKQLEEAKNKYSIKNIIFEAHRGRKFPMRWYKKIGMKETPWIYLEGNINKVIKKIESK